jgi:hypothetical protein
MEIETASVQRVVCMLEDAIARYNKKSLFKTSFVIKQLAWFVAACREQDQVNLQHVRLPSQAQVHLLRLVFGCADKTESVHTQEALEYLRYQLSGARCFQRERQSKKAYAHALVCIRTTVDQLADYRCLTQPIIQQLCRLYETALRSDGVDMHSTGDKAEGLNQLARFRKLLTRLDVLDRGMENYPLLQPSVLLHLLKTNFFITFPAIESMMYAVRAEAVFSGSQGCYHLESLLKHPNAEEALHVMAVLMRYMPSLPVLDKQHSIFDVILKPAWKVIALKEILDVVESEMILQHHEEGLESIVRLFTHILTLELPEAENHVEGMRKLIQFIPYLPGMKAHTSLKFKIEQCMAFLTHAQAWLTSMTYAFFFEESALIEREGISCQTLRHYLSEEGFYTQLIQAAEETIHTVSWFDKVPTLPHSTIHAVLRQLIQEITTKKITLGRLPTPEELGFSHIEKEEKVPYYTSISSYP